MTAFPDTSFLFALYRPQDNSAAARKHYEAMTEPVAVSGLLLYEFRQSMRFQVWLHAQNPKKGITANEADQAIADLASNLASGALQILPVDTADVLRVAERLSAACTKTGGHRAFDILHVATALVLEAEDFISFDGNQRKLAAAEGLKVKPSPTAAS